MPFACGPLKEANRKGSETMIKTPYHYEVKGREGLLMIRLSGEVDHHSARPLREELDRLILQKQPRRLVLDLSAIEFMDSSGLGLLMGRLRLMQELRGVMVLENPNPRIRKILRLAGMERFFEIDGVKGERR